MRRSLVRLAQAAARRVLHEDLDRVNRRLDLLELAADRDRSRQDIGTDLVKEYESVRSSSTYQAAFDEVEPLVTVVIATYNRSRLLIERSLASILDQTYERLQILVVGDHCTDDTFERLGSVMDPRIESINLPVRGPYPSDPYKRWMVAGSPAMNEGLRRARGTFITHLDDDDTHAPHRVEALLHHIQSERLDLVWHPFRYQKGSEEWLVNHADYFAAGKITTSSIFYHNWLKRIEWDPNAYLSSEPGDWNRLRKLLWLQVEAGRHDDLLLDHYPERGNS